MHCMRVLLHNDHTRASQIMQHTHKQKAVTGCVEAEKFTISSKAIRFSNSFGFHQVLAKVVWRSSRVKNLFLFFSRALRKITERVEKTGKWKGGEKSDRKSVIMFCIKYTLPLSLWNFSQVFTANRTSSCGTGFPLKTNKQTNKHTVSWPNNWYILQTLCNYRCTPVYHISYSLTALTCI